MQQDSPDTAGHGIILPSQPLRSSTYTHRVLWLLTGTVESDSLQFLPFSTKEPSFARIQGTGRFPKKRDARADKTRRETRARGAHLRKLLAAGDRFVLRQRRRVGQHVLGLPRPPPIQRNA